MNSLSFGSTGNIFISPLFLKDIFTGYRILDWQVDPSPALEWYCIVFWPPLFFGKASHHLMVPPYIPSPWLLLVFSLWFLAVWLWCAVVWVFLCLSYLGYFFFKFRIYVWIFFRFQSLFLHIFSCPRLSCLIFWDSSHMIIRLLVTVFCVTETVSLFFPFQMFFSSRFSIWCFFIVPVSLLVFMFDSYPSFLLKL